MPKTLRQQRRPKLHLANGIDVIGTKEWREKVPPHLQIPLAKALAAMEANDLGTALKHFGECAELDPFSKPVLYFGGQAAAQGYFSLKQRDPHHPNLAEWRNIAETLVTVAYEVAPDDAVACHNAGRFLQDVGERDRAIGYYRHASLLDSTQVETWGNLGTAYYESGDVSKAWDAWTNALKHPAKHASGRLSQSYIQLRKGEYLEGWKNYGARWGDPAFLREYGRERDLGPRRWTGEDLPKSHRLLLHGEQGLGDHVQFARYIPLLIDRGINVVGLETRAPLKRWMQASFPTLDIFTRDLDPLPDFTHHCSTLDLPHLLGTTLETIPEPVNFSRYSYDRALKRSYWNVEYRCRFPESPLRVGIVWAGAAGNPADAMRSIAPEHLIHLADTKGVTWVNLQFAPDSFMVARSWLGANVVDGTEGITDTLDTAQVLRGLDLLITVDTLPAHLAGTLNVPTWVLHRFCREWRWLDQGESCPWYESVRSLTQPAPGDWPSLLTQVKQELDAMAPP